MAFKWRFAGGPMIAHLKWYLDPLSLDQLQKKEKKDKRSQSWTPSVKTSLTNISYMFCVGYSHFVCLQWFWTADLIFDSKVKVRNTQNLSICLVTPTD